MTRLVGAEFLKLRTTRTFYALTPGALALIVLIAGAASLALELEDTADPGREIITIAELVQTLALVLGVLAASTEFRHGTITPTLLVTPSRGPLVAAKLGAHLVAGLALGLIAFGVTAAIALSAFSLREIPSSLEGVLALAAAGTTLLRRRDITA